MVLPFLISLISLLPTLPESTDELADTLKEAVHVSSSKQILPMERLASPVTVVSAQDMEKAGLDNTKDFSSLVPNLHIPDYGSAMTSSIYLRGFGSRIDNPVIGLYIDDIPVMNKNSYDMDFSDISSASLLRGPQATLYGRNSMCGVLALSTLSPETADGARASLEYGNANTVNARLSFYGGSGYGGMNSGAPRFGLSLGYRHSDGFFYNNYDGKETDRYDAANVRLRVWDRLRRDLVFENIFTASVLGQGGYPYRQYDAESGSLAPVSYNDECGYRRLNVTEGVKFKYMNRAYTLQSISSIQFLSDEMTLDQDFTERSMFTLVQAQNEGAVTQELILKPEAPLRTPWWNWQSGFFGFAKYNAMSAPVRFKKDGIDDLILANANAGMQNGIPGAELHIKQDEFDISSDFGIATAGAALYHESVFTVGRWLLTAGLRLDYEWSGMTYDSRAKIDYRLTAPELVTGDYVGYECIYDGFQRNSYLEAMPKLSALYDAGPVKFFATFSEGYKSGGFNTQIFSDILQNRMMEGIMSGLGVEMDSASSVGASNTVYRPERSFNSEIGLRFGTGENGYTFSGTLSFYGILCADQQITVFPPGKSTGRMMANVGRSRSVGAETELHYAVEGLSLSVSYGYCDARFLKYDDGNNDWSGNRIPYSPEHTLYARLGHVWNLYNDYFRSVEAGVSLSGTGRIWWDEANSLVQPFYALLGADIRGNFKWFEIFLRGENLTGYEYRTFYFKSVGNSFFQTGKPMRFTLGMSFCKC